jgi:hypothetical protein
MFSYDVIVMRIGYLIFNEIENELYDHYKSLLTDWCSYFIVTADPNKADMTTVPVCFCIP